MGRIAALITVAVAVGLAACDDPPLPPPATRGTNVQAAGALPKVADIAAAVAAVEAKLGGPQQFFEINATPLVVNLFVAVHAATRAEAFTYVDGTVASKPAGAASGHTFAGSALHLDATHLLDRVRTQLPGSVIEGVEIVGGPAGTTRITVIVHSPTGTTMLVVVDPTGSVVSVADA